MEEEPNICRFCFEGEDCGELIEPCSCSGSQRFVHVQCLRRWQAHQILAAASRRTASETPVIQCNVCHATLSVPPPSGKELLSIVRPNGSQIAGAIAKGVLLVSKKTDDPPDVSAMPSYMAAILLKRLAHWCNHIFLLYDEQALDGGTGDERLFGINLSREVRMDESTEQVLGASSTEILTLDALKSCLPCDEAMRARIKEARQAGVLVRFFIGGPCAPKEVVCIHTESAVESSHPAVTTGEIRFGGWWQLVLSAAIARVREGAAKPVVCLCFGHARWGREQLHNEVLRGDWGVNAEAATAEFLLSDRAVAAHEDLVPESAGTHYIAPPS